MTKLIKALNSWGSTTFNKILKQELENLESGVLPLYQATQLGGQADDTNIAVLVNSVSDNDTVIQVDPG